MPDQNERRAIVQAEFGLFNKPPGTISWKEHLEVYAAYVMKCGNSQSAERIVERGGFGYREAEYLLGRKLHTWQPR